MPPLDIYKSAFAQNQEDALLRVVHGGEWQGYGGEGRDLSQL